MADLALFQKIDICLSKSSCVYVVDLQVYQIQFFFSEQTERVLEFPSVSKLLENCLRVWFLILSHYLDDLKWILINKVGRVVE